MRFLRRRLLVLGMATTILLGLFLVYAIWKGLLYREAIHYAKEFSIQIKETVKAADMATAKVFEPHFYRKLHKKPLSQMNQLTTQPPLSALYQKIKELFYDPEAYLAVFTDCNAENYAFCYRDNDMDSPNPQYPLVGYDPKSRPWYLATRTHTDWVLLNFMLHGHSLISPYPPTYGVALAKHILQGEKEMTLQRLAQDPKRLAQYVKDEDGIWLVFGFTATKAMPRKENASISDDIFLKLVTQDQTENFSSFEVSFENLRFSKRVLGGTAPFDVVCSATSKFLSVFSYLATVPCKINGEPILFLFSKSYDHPANLMGLGFALLCLLYVAYRFFNYVEVLQEQNFQKTIDLEKGKMINAIGAKLVHDLKKGIVAQLDNLYQEFGKDFEQEAARPDFTERLQSKLKHHFFYLHMLRKYMNLLNNNFRRKKEEEWVWLNPEKFKEYLTWILGPVSVMIQKNPLAAPSVLECLYEPGTDHKLPVISFQVVLSFPSFAVPEMAFYRILKNVWENFNTYGVGVFRISFERQEGGMVMRAQNHVSVREIAAQESTHLGVTIIRQLLEDNFGTKATVHQTQKGDDFVLEIFLPERQIP